MRRSESIFAQVTRHVISEKDVDPREDRLTEITASVLERVPGLARRLALAWLDPDGARPGETARPNTRGVRDVVAALPIDSRVEVRTQVVLPSRRVDLEVRLLQPETRATAALLWVENKHGTSAHTDQLSAYVADLPAGWPSAVVLLAPRDTLPAAEDQASPEVPERTWQRTAALAQGFRIEDPVARFVRDEWLNYLHEEGLMDVQALGPEHLTALAYWRETQEGLVRVVEEAARVLHQKHKRSQQKTSNGKPVFGLGYWSTTELPGGGEWNDWTLD